MSHNLAGDRPDGYIERSERRRQPGMRKYGPMPGSGFQCPHPAGRSRTHRRTPPPSSSTARRFVRDVLGLFLDPDAFGSRRDVGSRRGHTHTHTSHEPPIMTSVLRRPCVEDAARQLRSVT